jgi:dihydropyrimidinase
MLILAQVSASEVQAMFETIIRGGTIATAADTFVADIGIRDGRVVALANGLKGAGEVIDARGKLVLPGGIDSHVHIAQPSGPGIVMADDFESCTRSAAFGGNTTVLPFCLQETGTPLRETVNAYHTLAEGKCHVDVSFHLIIADPCEQVLGQELPALVKDGYTSFKVFMTYDGLALTDLQIMETMAVAKDTGALMMIHAENYDMIRFLTAKLEKQGDTAPFFHAKSRPIPVSEVPLVVVHVSNREAMEEIRRAQAKGLKIRAETCPQYLVLTEDDLKGLNMEGAKYVCSPPPRDKASQIACWEGLTTGVFSLFSSDHCPFRYDDAQGKMAPKGKTSFRWVPNGIPGVGARLPILFSEGVSKGRIDINTFVAVTSTNHAKTYGLYPRKGTIAVGSDADVVIWDPKKRMTISNANQHHGADYTPYEGIKVKGWPVLTMVRGKTVVKDGALVSSSPIGIYQSRHTSPLTG